MNIMFTEISFMHYQTAQYKRGLLKYCYEVGMCVSVCAYMCVCMCICVCVCVQMCELDSEACLSNIDLILKWHTLRFFDTNTTVLMKQLEYLQVLLNMAAAERYYLHELEAVSFIPYLINKV